MTTFAILVAVFTEPYANRVHRCRQSCRRERDDLKKATRNAVMMLRPAKTAEFYDVKDREIVYPNLGIY
jgi:hypothetical protein